MAVQDGPDIVIGASPAAWIVVPNTWPWGGHDVPRDWATSVASERVGMHPGTESLEDWVRDTLQMIAETTPENEIRALLLPSPTSAFMIVRVQYAVSSGDRDRALTVLAGVDDPDAVERPIVEPFAARGLGDGVRAVRHHLAEDRRLTGILTFAFRAGPYDVRVSCADADLARLTALTPSVEEFVHTIALDPPTAVLG